MTLARIALAVVLVLGVLFAGSRIIGTTGDPAPAPTSPIDVLEADPLAGKAFAALAKAEPDPARKLELHQIAARRAPRDIEARAWLFEHYLAAGDYRRAMEQLDLILRLAPAIHNELLPAVVQLAGDEEFSGALVDVMKDDPVWRPALLGVMQSEVESPGSARVFAGLRELDALQDDEAGRWLDALIGAGVWGQAYSLWASGKNLQPGESLPMLWDGAFELGPDMHGFGWRIGRKPGSYTELQQLDGATGRAARIVFLGRPVGIANLEQPMHLPPGSYRITMRLASHSLRSDQGLTWTVACAGGTLRFLGEPISGTFDWRDYAFDFNVPVTDCPGQWLRLTNPAPSGSTSIVTGELWIDDVTLAAIDNPE